MLIDLIIRHNNWVKENPDWKKKSKKQELLNNLKENITDLTPTNRMNYDIKNEEEDDEK